MEKFHKKANVRKQLEFLNIAIGLVLVAISFVYFLGGEIDYFASWFIFGCMYIVMDKYWPSDSYSSKRIKMDIFKYFVNILGLIVSIGFLVYLIST